MPELPEIETIRRSLLPGLLGKTVASVVVHDSRLRQPVDGEKLRRLLEGSSLVDIRRRAKYLLFYWDTGTVLLVHLGMSGRLGLFEKNQAIEPHTHVVFSFVDGVELRFRDPRRFGSITVDAQGGIGDNPSLKHLGVEPLSSSFRITYIRRFAGRTQRPIKTLLMDNRFLVGVGNIYANEALHHAGIHPLRAACSLNEDEMRHLREAVVGVLRKAIRRGGTTLKDFRNGLGEPGFFQVDLLVYGREGELCRCCGGKIERIVAGGRSTFFCRRCQK